MDDTPNLEEIREHIEGRYEKATAGPTEGYDQMEEAAAEARQQAEQHPEWSEGQDIPTQPVSEADRMAEPPQGSSGGY